MSRVFRNIHATSAPGVLASEVLTNLDPSGTSGQWSLSFSANIQGSNKRDDPYHTIIACRYKPSTERKSALIVSAVVSEHGPLLVMAEHPTTKTRFKVSCTCQDYTYTYSRPNHFAGYHLGAVPKIPKAKGTGAPRNPKNITGSCKHILALHAALLKSKTIK